MDPQATSCTIVHNIKSQVHQSGPPNARSPLHTDDDAAAIGNDTTRTTPMLPSPASDNEAARNGESKGLALPTPATPPTLSDNSSTGTPPQNSQPNHKQQQQQQAVAQPPSAIAFVRPTPFSMSSSTNGRSGSGGDSATVSGGRVSTKNTLLSLSKMTSASLQTGSGILSDSDCNNKRKGSEAVLNEEEGEESEVRKRAMRAGLLSLSIVPEPPPMSSSSSPIVTILDSHRITHESDGEPRPAALSHEDQPHMSSSSSQQMQMKSNMQSTMEPNVPLPPSASADVVTAGVSASVDPHKALPSAAEAVVPAQSTPPPPPLPSAVPVTLDDGEKAAASDSAIDVASTDVPFSEFIESENVLPLTYLQPRRQKHPPPPCAGSGLPTLPSSSPPAATCSLPPPMVTTTTTTIAVPLSPTHTTAITATSQQTCDTAPTSLGFQVAPLKFEARKTGHCAFQSNSGNSTATDVILRSNAIDRSCGSNDISGDRDSDGDLHCSHTLLRLRASYSTIADLNSTQHPSHPLPVPSPHAPPSEEQKALQQTTTTTPPCEGASPLAHPHVADGAASNAERSEPQPPLASHVLGTDSSDHVVAHTAAPCAEAPTAATPTRSSAVMPATDEVHTSAEANAMVTISQQTLSRLLHRLDAMEAAERERCRESDALRRQLTALEEAVTRAQLGASRSPQSESDLPSAQVTPYKEGITTEGSNGTSNPTTAAKRGTNGTHTSSPGVSASTASAGTARARARNAGSPTDEMGEEEEDDDMGPLDEEENEMMEDDEDYDDGSSSSPAPLSISQRERELMAAVVGKGSGAGHRRGRVSRSANRRTDSVEAPVEDGNKDSSESRRGGEASGAPCSTAPSTELGAKKVVDLLPVLTPNSSCITGDGESFTSRAQNASPTPPSISFSSVSNNRRIGSSGGSGGGGGGVGGLTSSEGMTIETVSRTLTREIARLVMDKEQLAKAIAETRSKLHREARSRRLLGTSYNRHRHTVNSVLREFAYRMDEIQDTFVTIVKENMGVMVSTGELQEEDSHSAAAAAATQGDADSATRAEAEHVASAGRTTQQTSDQREGGKEVREAAGDHVQERDSRVSRHRPDHSSVTHSYPPSSSLKKRQSPNECTEHEDDNVTTAPGTTTMTTAAEEAAPRTASATARALYDEASKPPPLSPSLLVEHTTADRHYVRCETEHVGQSPGDNGRAVAATEGETLLSLAAQCAVPSSDLSTTTTTTTTVLPSISKRPSRSGRLHAPRATTSSSLRRRGSSPASQHTAAAAAAAAASSIKHASDAALSATKAKQKTLRSEANAMQREGVSELTVVPITPTAAAAAAGTTGTLPPSVGRAQRRDSSQANRSTRRRSSAQPRLPFTSSSSAFKGRSPGTWSLLPPTSQQSQQQLLPQTQPPKNTKKQLDSPQSSAPPTHRVTSTAATTVSASTHDTNLVTEGGDVHDTVSNDIAGPATDAVVPTSANTTAVEASPLPLKASHSPTKSARHRGGEDVSPSSSLLPSTPSSHTHNGGAKKDGDELRGSAGAASTAVASTNVLTTASCSSLHPSDHTHPPTPRNRTATTAAEATGSSRLTQRRRRFSVGKGRGDTSARESERGQQCLLRSPNTEAVAPRGSSRSARQTRTPREKVSHRHVNAIQPAPPPHPPPPKTAPGRAPHGSPRGSRSQCAGASGAAATPSGNAHRSTSSGKPRRTVRAATAGSAASTQAPQQHGTAEALPPSLSSHHRLEESSANATEPPRAMQTDAPRLGTTMTHGADVAVASAPLVDSHHTKSSPLLPVSGASILKRTPTPPSSFSPPSMTGDGGQLTRSEAVSTLALSGAHRGNRLNEDSAGDKKAESAADRREEEEREEEEEEVDEERELGNNANVPSSFVARLRQLTAHEADSPCSHARHPPRTPYHPRSKANTESSGGGGGGGSSALHVASAAAAAGGVSSATRRVARGFNLPPTSTSTDAATGEATGPAVITREAVMTAPASVSAMPSDAADLRTEEDCDVGHIACTTASSPEDEPPQLTPTPPFTSSTGTMTTTMTATAADTAAAMDAPTSSSSAANDRSVSALVAVAAGAAQVGGATKVGGPTTASPQTDSDGLPPRVTPPIPLPPSVSSFSSQPQVATGPSSAPGGSRADVSGHSSPSPLKRGGAGDEGERTTHSSCSSSQASPPQTSTSSRVRQRPPPLTWDSLSESTVTTVATETHTGNAVVAVAGGIDRAHCTNATATSTMFSDGLHTVTDGREGGSVGSGEASNTQSVPSEPSAAATAGAVMTMLSAAKRSEDDGTGSAVPMLGVSLPSTVSVMRNEEVKSDGAAYGTSASLEDATVQEKAEPTTKASRALPVTIDAHGSTSAERGVVVGEGHSATARMNHTHPAVTVSNGEGKADSVPPTAANSSCSRDSRRPFLYDATTIPVGLITMTLHEHDRDEEGDTVWNEADHDMRKVSELPPPQRQQQQRKEEEEEEHEAKGREEAANARADSRRESENKRRRDSNRCEAIPRTDEESLEEEENEEYEEEEEEVGEEVSDESACARAAAAEAARTAIPLHHLSNPDTLLVHGSHFKRHRSSSSSTPTAMQTVSAVHDICGSDGQIGFSSGSSKESMTMTATANTSGAGGCGSGTTTGTSSVTNGLFISVGSGAAVGGGVAVMSSSMTPLESLSANPLMGYSTFNAAPASALPATTTTQPESSTGAGATNTAPTTASAVVASGTSSSNVNSSIPLPTTAASTGVPTTTTATTNGNSNATELRVSFFAPSPCTEDRERRRREKLAHFHAIESSILERMGLPAQIQQQQATGTASGATVGMNVEGTYPAQPLLPPRSVKGATEATAEEEEEEDKKQSGDC